MKDKASRDEKITENEHIFDTYNFDLSSSN